MFMRWLKREIIRGFVSSAEISVDADLDIKDGQLFEKLFFIFFENLVSFQYSLK